MVPASASGRRIYTTASEWREEAGPRDETRLSRGGRRSVWPALAMLVAAACGGCSVSLPVASGFAETSAAEVDVVTTSSLAPPPNHPLSPDLGPEDWRRARAALAVALDPQGNGEPASWDNPASTLKGSFTPLGAPFVKDDQICRAFSAALTLQDRSRRHLKGVGCRISAGEWGVRDVAPARSGG